MVKTTKKTKMIKTQLKNQTYLTTKMQVDTTTRKLPTFHRKKDRKQLNRLNYKNKSD